MGKGGDPGSVLSYQMVKTGRRKSSEGMSVQSSSSDMAKGKV